MDELQQEWKFTRQLTTDLLQACSDHDLGFVLNAHSGALWKQFRHIGRVQENYLSALSSGQIKFDTAGGSFRSRVSTPNLSGYFAQLEKYHISRFAALRCDQMVSWFGEEVRPHIHLGRLLAHEALHQGQLILYWRALGYRFPKSWAQWGENCCH